jgi:xanthine dehydrogenase YagR molybdenum-binding subunit
MPDAPATSAPDVPVIKVVGQPLNRTDGRLKVTGAAVYAADAQADDVAHGVFVQATIPSGRIRRIDSSGAQSSPGVLAVITHENAPKLKQPKPDFTNGGMLGEMRMPFIDDKITYAGQNIALVVGETLDQARFAASLIAVEYDVTPPILDRAAAEKNAEYPAESMGEKLQYQRGDAEKALAHPDVVKIDATYMTPIEHHNPMELGGTVALWNHDKLVVHDATQWIKGVQASLAEAFDIPRDNVRVLCPFVGGAFGCKGSQWPHTFAAAMAAKQIGRPVKIYVTRKGMFTGMGHRPQTIQRLVIAATPDARLTAIRHEVVQDSSFLADYLEPAALVTSRLLYDCPNVDLPHKVIRLNLPTSTFMRAPGECPGSFAIESALDELAAAIKIDPVQLRIINHADTNPASGLPWSSKYLKECYQVAGDAFGWSKRNPEPRSMRDADGRLLGWGMATATYPGYMFPASARVRLLPDGRAFVSSATHDLGTGAWTAFSQISADILGLPLSRVKFQLGDSTLPPAPVAGGSNTTASVGQAIFNAAQKLKGQLFELALTRPNAPLQGLKADDVHFINGRLASKNDSHRGHDLRELISAGRPHELEATAMAVPGKERTQYAFQSFGCHFVEVTIDESLGRIRVSRAVTAIDNGRVINAKTARSQILGGVTMGIGMALMEETHFHNGRAINDNLADYAVCTNADVHTLDVHFIDKPDPRINALGCRGIGEIGIVGVAAAVANAVYHATGRRIRELPITSDKLL